MIKFNKKSNNKLNIFKIFSIFIFFQGCSQYDDMAANNYKFNTSPVLYQQAQKTAQITVPKHMANNIEIQPLYVVPDDNTKLNGKLGVSAVPPTLDGKIKTYG